MDPTLLIGFAVVAVVAIAVALAMPAMARDQRRRQAAGGGVGLGAGLDAVWRPSAEDAHADWKAAVEMPAPAPAPGDKGLDDGPLVIEVPRDQRMTGDGADPA